MSIEPDEPISILRLVKRGWQKMIQGARLLFRLIGPGLVIGFGVSFFIIVFGFSLVEGQLAEASSTDMIKLSIITAGDRPPAQTLAGDRLQASQPQLESDPDFESVDTTRLLQNDLTSAALTKNRLTGSHLFVDVPASPRSQP